VQKKTEASNIWWRIITFPIIRIIIALICVEVSTWVLRSLAEYFLYTLSVQDGILKTLIVFMVRVSAVYFAYILFVRFFEKRKATELQFDRKMPKEIFMGGFIGLVCIVIVMGSMWLLGFYSIISMNKITAIIPAFTFDLFSVVNQDIVFFGIIFRITEERLGSWIAIFFASLLFGFIHLSYPDFALWQVIFQSIEAGILFSGFYILTRRLWMIIGFHFIWNFIQFGIMGIHKMAMQPTPLINSELSGPHLLTGGAVGPEGSIITLILCSSLGLYFVYKAISKNRIVPPFWQKSALRSKPVEVSNAD
jgi:membrane protease YdiL (CAAX protease family)